MSDCNLLLITFRLRCISTTSPLTAGAPHACYPRDLDTRRHTRIYPERGLLPMGRDGYPDGRIAEPCWHRSPQASWAISPVHLSHGETGPARVCARRVGAHPEHQILSASDVRGEAGGYDQGETGEEQSQFRDSSRVGAAVGHL